LSEATEKKDVWGRHFSPQLNRGMKKSQNEIPHNLYHSDYFGGTCRFLMSDDKCIRN
jgi:hypothetical protein